MATRVKGHVLERNWKRGRGYAIRFSAYGRRRYVTLGFEGDGWTRDRAEVELANVVADVRRGLWMPRRKEERRDGSTAINGDRLPMFGTFARELVASREGQVADGTHRHEKWTLGHLLGFFADWWLDEIDVKAVDAYRIHKVKESEARRRAIKAKRPLRDGGGRILRPLSAGSINKTISHLQWLLSMAVEYKLIDENPAVGRRRRLRELRRPPVYLDTPGQIEALLGAASQLDSAVASRCRERHAIIATLVLAGPRAGELCGLQWRDVDLANSRISIGHSKTQAGLREINMLPLLRDSLVSYKARVSRSGSDDLVFPSGTGGRRDKNNLRSRVLIPVLERADLLLEDQGRVPLPRGLTAHKLRHTFASVLIARGEDPYSVMRQLGHTDPAFTLRVYTHGMGRRAEERAHLAALVGGEGTSASSKPPNPSSQLHTKDYEAPIVAALTRLGGGARRREIVAAVREELAAQMSGVDLEPVPSGMTRWQTRLSKARTNLLKRGLLRTGSPRGFWELSNTVMRAAGNPHSS